MSNNKWIVKAYTNLGFAPTIYEGKTIYLLTPKQFNKLPDGVKVICIDGSEAIKGIDNIDKDTRAGYLAYGLIEVKKIEQQ